MEALKVHVPRSVKPSTKDSYALEAPARDTALDELNRLNLATGAQE